MTWMDGCLFFVFRGEMRSSNPNLFVRDLVGYRGVPVTASVSAAVPAPQQ